jgi:hypothetical protein
VRSWGAFIALSGGYLALRWRVGLSECRRIGPCLDDDGQNSWFLPAAGFAACLVWPVWSPVYPPWIDALAWLAVAAGGVVSELACRVISRRGTPVPPPPDDP